MSKKRINYSDLSAKELETLKDTYIELKVKSMSNNDLKNFVIENISLQIKNTVGNDEEIEAWQEMEGFFKDEFVNTIRDIQVKIQSNKSENNNLHNEEIKFEVDKKEEDKKLDMWED
tara:strand:+ start:204 stop:554 length:351 start_codon:yes stop_codon:yes gene_type:complete